MVGQRKETEMTNALNHTISRGTACAAVGGALLAAARPERLSAQPLQSVAVGLIGRTASQWPWYIGDQLGYFKKYGVATSLIVVDSVASCAQQLTAGSLNVGELSSTQVVEAAKGGAPIKYVINDIVTPPYWLIAKSNVRSIADLKGKTIIIGGVNDITHIFLDAMTKAAGLRPDDYTLTFAGATNVRYAALKSGSVDAAILLPPFSFVALSDGYVDLGSVLKYFGAFPFVGIGANTNWAQSHQTTLVALTKGFLESLRWLNDPRNRSRAVALLMSTTNIDATNAGKTYDALITQLHSFSRSGLTSIDDFNKVVAALVSLKQIEPPPPVATQFYDNRYVQQATAQLSAH